MHKLLILLTLLSASLHGADNTDLIGKFRNTFYYYIDEKDYPRPANKIARIIDLKGNVIATVSPTFKKDLDMEGTGKLINGRMINYIARIHGEIRYEVTVHPYGRGIGNCALIPFHTIAVDPKKIPLGSIVKIDKTVGMRLPDGSVHDGIWRAEDVGGAINNDRIDIFTGDDRLGTTLEKHGITHLMPLNIRLISKAPPDSCIHEEPR